MYNDNNNNTTLPYFSTIILPNSIGTNNDTSIPSVYPMDTEEDIYLPDDKHDCNNVTIYRYKFSETFIHSLHSFSKIHQYDDRPTFKEAWTIWTDENKELVELEIRRLQSLHYEGSILDKMYKSARYYFRKKSSEVKEPKKRGVYVSLQKELLDLMDKHISTNSLSSNDFKPSSGFTDFCINNQNMLKDEIKRLMELNITDINIIKNKMKKTYKNRYFILLKKENKIIDRIL